MSSAIQVGVSPFPQPPEYAKQYTNENIAKKNVLPPPPIPCEFTVFGEDYNFEEVLAVLFFILSSYFSAFFSTTNYIDSCDFRAIKFYQQIAK